MTEAAASNVRLALYQPDIPQNAGNLFRTAACFGVAVDVIEPCGFAFSNSRMRRAGMDYLDQLTLQRHESWQAYQSMPRAGRLVLLTTKGDVTMPEFRFAQGDTLMLGRESAGVPEDVHQAADVRLGLPMTPGVRSLNVAVSGAIAMFEALRQLHGLPVSNSMPAPEHTG